MNFNTDDLAVLFRIDLEIWYLLLQQAVYKNCNSILALSKGQRTISHLYLMSTEQVPNFCSEPESPEDK